jgi:hypothetical protein
MLAGKKCSFVECQYSLHWKFCIHPLSLRLLSPQRNHPIAMPAVESPILFFSLDIDNHFSFRFLNIA